MKLWTIQPKNVLDILETDGIFRCDIAKSSFCNEYIRPAYDWLVEQMSREIPIPEGVRYPIWAWYKRDGKRYKPDLRNTGYGAHGDEMVCLEVDIPDNEVLLSDFDAWHFVLNRMYLDDSMSEEEWERTKAYFDSLPHDRREQVMRESWSRIFDISPFKNDWRTRGCYVQATFWELCKEQIRRVQHFRAR